MHFRMRRRLRERPDVEEKALLALDRADYPCALELLMEGYGTDIYRYCRHTLSDPERAKDVLQKTFVDAYEAFPSFARRSSLRVWLFGIAHHRCQDEMKFWRRWRRRAKPVETMPDIANDEPSPVEEILERQWAEALERCLRELAPQARYAVVLRYAEDYQYPQMAEICNERAATLQARVARALRVLHGCLERLGFKR